MFNSHKFHADLPHVCKNVPQTISLLLVAACMHAA